MKKDNKKLRESVLSYFKLKKEENGVDISPSPFKSIPQIETSKNNYNNNNDNKEKKNTNNYISSGLVDTLGNLNRKIESVTKGTQQHTDAGVVKNLITNNYNTHPIKSSNNQKTIIQKIITTPKATKIPAILQPIASPSDKEEKKTKRNNINNINNVYESNNQKTQKIINHINKTFLTKSNTQNNTANHHSLQNTSTSTNIPTINKIQNIQSTDNTINKDEPNTIKEIPVISKPIVVNNRESNTTHKAVSKVLNRNINTDRITNKKSYLISTSTINKILSGKVHVPKAIPAYGDGGEVTPKFGGQLSVIGDKGEAEHVIPDSKIIKSVTKQPNLGKTTSPTAMSAGADAMNQNASLKVDKDNESSSDDTFKEGNAPIVNAPTSTSVPPAASAAPMGMSSKVSNSMRAQTMYPRWRTGIG